MVNLQKLILVHQHMRQSLEMFYLKDLQELSFQKCWMESQNCTHYDLLIVGLIAENFLIGIIAHILDPFNVWKSFIINIRIIDGTLIPSWN